MNEVFCASSPEAAALSDAEFWAKVYPQPEHEDDPEPEDYPEMLAVGNCLRCGGLLLAEDYQQMRRIIDQDMELCDECTDELAPDIEDIF